LGFFSSLPFFFPQHITQNWHLEFFVVMQRYFQHQDHGGGHQEDSNLEMDHCGDHIEIVNSSSRNIESYKLLTLVPNQGHRGAGGDLSRLHAGPVGQGRVSSSSPKL
jgi:hypothetical protein